MRTHAHAPSRRSTHLRRSIAAALCVAAGITPALTVQAAHAAPPTGFSAGDVVVYRVGTGSGALGSGGTAVFLDEYSPAGALVQSVAMPTAASGSNKPLVASGTASSEGMLTLSPNGSYLAMTGYDAAVGTSKVGSTSAASTPRTVGIVGASDSSIDTSTALTDLADTNNVRSAVTTDGNNIWVGGASSAKNVPADGPAVRFTTDGSSTSTPVVSSTYTNVRQVGIFNGQLYTSADPTKAGALSVASVGTGTPESGSNAPVNLTGLPTSNFDPYDYAFLTLGTTGPAAPDTLYVADNTAGAVDKFSLENGTWTATGAVNLPGVTGVTANDNAGIVTVYATSNGTGSAAGTLGTLYSFTDSSGQGGTLSGSATAIATAPANESFRGVAFAPGTTIGSGGPPPPPPPPTITAAEDDLPAALGDPTNATLGLTLNDSIDSVDSLTVSATSSNTAVAPLSGITIGGSGASRTLTVTPGGTVGESTIGLTVTAPDGRHSETDVTYGVSANLGDPSDRYFSGAGNASSAIDVGDGYMLVGDDESNIIRLYNETESGPPVKTFDFTSQLPFGTTEIDIEASARAGDMLYWTGSMSNNSSGDLAPARSTLFAARITGSGANIDLSFVGSYTGLQSDLVNWDENNGSGLGANYFGFNASVNGGVDSHEINALNVEGMEFAGSSSSTAYLAFRAPLEPTSDRHLALVIPVTNINGLVTGAASSATFGTPMMWDLGGLGIREIRENADGQYLVIAGTSDDSNSSFTLYTWDGNPADQPRLTGTTLPLVPSGANQGSWETIVSVPDPLVSGASVQLLEDNGDTAWYGNGETSKDTLPAALQKDLGRVFSYAPPSPQAVTVAVDADNNPAVTGQPITFTADVSASGTSVVPTGTMEFSVGGSDLPGCSAVPLDSTGAAKCSVPAGFAAGTTDVVAAYSGDSSFAAADNSASPYDEVVDQAATTTAVVAQPTSTVTGQDVSFTASIAVVAPGTTAPATPDGSVEFQADGSDLPGCGAVQIDSTGTAECDVSNGLPAGTTDVVAIYSGDANYAGSDNSASPVVDDVQRAGTSTTLSADNDPVVTGQPVTLTAVVTATSPGSTAAVLPGGSIDFQADGSDLQGCGAVPIDSTGSATCTVESGFTPSNQTITAAYTGDDNFVGSNAPNLSETVNQDATTVEVTASANPPVAGQPVTYSASVLPVGPGAGTPTGTVTFTITGPKKPAPVCSNGNTVTLAGGSASCLVPASKLTVGATYSVSVTYTGDSNFTGSSGSLQQTIAQGATSVSLSSSSNPSVSGAAVTVQASVSATSPSTGTPTGTVTFAVTGSDGWVVTCKTADTVKVASGTAKCTLPAGALTTASAPYTVDATYSGSASFGASSGSLSQQVSKAPTTTKIQQSAAKTAAGEAVTFVATVKPTPAKRAPLGGSVTFTVTGASGATVECDSEGGGSTTQSGGGDYVASCTVPAGILTFANGPYQVVATYSGDASDSASSAGLVHQVSKPKN